MITKLKKEIEDIEASITEDMSKEEMYDFLVKAYFKAKDIIALLENTTAPDTSAELQDIKEKYNLASTQLSIAEKEIQSMTKMLTAISDILR